MLGLVDGDIIAYRCSASCQGVGEYRDVAVEPEEAAIIRCDVLMRDILQHTDTQLTFLTGKNNFRYTINPEYKANRKDKAKPVHLQACRDFLIREYNAIVTDGYEADDALGFSQTEDSVIFSIDKDLLMVPGNHYNFVRNEYTEVSELDGLKSFYRSMLVGDTSDNVFGIKGIGPVKAAKLINHLEDEVDMFETVRTLYNDDDRFGMNAECLWIWRNLDETFSRRKEKSI